MGSVDEEDTLTFELKLPSVQRLVIHFNSSISGKLETIKDTLDSGLTQCLSQGHQQPIRNLLDDLKTFQQAWPACNKFMDNDEATQTCHLRLMEVRELALQLMLANKINSRLKITHLLAPHPSGASAQASCAPKPPVSPKPVKPPKPSQLRVSAALVQRRGSASTAASESAAATGAARLAKHKPPASLSESESPLPSDSGGSELSIPDADEGSLPQLDLRKTFYCEDIIGEAALSGDAGTGAATSAAAASAVNALEELIATEKTYIRSMELLSDHYFPRLCADLPHLAEQLKDVFFDFSTFKKLHLELLQDLEQMAKAAEGDMSKFLVGHVMGKYGPCLRLYSAYYTKFKLHLNQVNDWMKDEAAKAAFLKAQSECPEPLDRKLDVTSHMLTPVQRPMRYPMLLGRYLKEIGQGHPDRPATDRALTSIENVTNGFNVKVSEVESLQKLLVILQEVTFPSELQEERDKFICSQYLLSAGVLKISSKNRQQIRFLILSSTVLLLCEVSALNWKTVQVAIPVSSDLVLTLDEQLSADYPNCIRLQTQQKTYDISFATLKEFDDWIAAFKKLNVTFGDACPVDVRFPWKTFDDQQMGKKQPIKQKDHDVSQCQACRATFTTFNRRHHCRICGGIFCGGCSRYKCSVAWADSPRRCCFFCKDRIDRRDGISSVLDMKHRELKLKFEKRQSKSGGALIQGYLNVRVEVLNLKLSKSPRFLQDHWAKMWCTVDQEVFSVYKMKKDFVPAHKVVLALNLTVESVADSPEVRLRLKDIEICRLQMTEDAGLRSAQREASHLDEWFDILRKGAQILGV